MAKARVSSNVPTSPPYEEQASAGPRSADSREGQITAPEKAVRISQAAFVVAAVAFILSLIAIVLD
jgi:hypothetical protein